MSQENRNFRRGPTILLRAVEQRDIDALVTNPEEPDTEIDRYEDAIAFPLSPEGQQENLRDLAKKSGMLFSNGQYYDELYFGLTAVEWEKIDPPLDLGQYRARAEGGP